MQNHFLHDVVGAHCMRPDLTWLPYNMKGACNAPLHGGNYYERVIGDEQELDALREYITANPAQWENDENHPHRRGALHAP
jgi:hypothetical protein